MKNVKYSSVVWQEGEHFVAQCLNVEVSSFGDSRDEALVNLEEALSLYFEDASIVAEFLYINSCCKPYNDSANLKPLFQQKYFLQYGIITSKITIGSTLK